MSQSKNKSIFEGIGIGLFIGLVLGYSTSDWVYVALSALALSAVGYVFPKKNGETTDDKSETDIAKSLKAGSMGFAVVVGMLFGLFFQQQMLFKPEIKKRVEYWTKAGFPEEKARALVLDEMGFKKKEKLEQKIVVTKDTSQDIAIKVPATDLPPIGLDSIKNRLDSLQNMLNELLEGGNLLTSTSVKENVTAVRNNLFSSDEKESLCEVLDPDAFEGDTAAFINAFEAREEEKLVAINTLLSSIPETDKHAFYLLFYELICSLELSPQENLCADLDPEQFGYDAEQMAEAFQAQNIGALKKIALWALEHSEAPDEFFVIMHEWLCGFSKPKP